MSRSPGSESSKQKLDEYVAGWEASFRLLREGRSWSGNERNNTFLNCGGERFTDISAATGLNFADDGRAFSVVDWDGDGDLDLWLYNRTGPRLRLMINGGESHGKAESSVAFRLRGKRSNRDGIGARVEVKLKNRPETRLIETLYAGDSFLSQSSKWLHFGLGRDSEIDQVHVRWPGGATETFSGIRPGERYILEEGSGQAMAETSRRAPSKLRPSAQPRPEASSGSRLFLPLPVPLPELRYASLDSFSESNPTTPVDPGSGPLLLNIWASWCLPCVAELEEMTERQEALRQAGLDVLAITVDGLDPDQTTGPVDARRLLDRLGFPFRAGVATPRMLEKIELVEDLIYDRKFPFGVPVSFLLDRQGRLAAAYRGPVDLDVLLGDVRVLGKSAQEVHDLSAPLPGRWQSRLPDVDLVWMAKKFKAGHPRDAERFLELALERKESATALLDLAELSFKRGLAERSMALLRRAVELDPDSSLAHKNLANLLRESGQPNEALTHYKRLLRLAPNDADMRYGLGITLLAVQDVSNAFGHLEIAARLDPESALPLAAMIGILINYSDPADPSPIREAIRLGERGAELTDRQDAKMLGALATAYAAAGRFSDATRAARDALELAQTLGDDELASLLASRLASYEQSRPHHESVPPP